MYTYIPLGEFLYSDVHSHWALLLSRNLKNDIFILPFYLTSIYWEVESWVEGCHVTNIVCTEDFGDPGLSWISWGNSGGLHPHFTLLMLRVCSGAGVEEGAERRGKSLQSRVPGSDGEAGLATQKPGSGGGHSCLLSTYPCQALCWAVYMLFEPPNSLSRLFF